MQKQVGNGKVIDFFNDLWIPKETSFKPLKIREVEVQEEMVVVEFITPSNGWNIDKFRDLVREEDARVIATIPTSTVNEEDQWIWHYSKNGAYSVKTGYKFSMMSSVGLVGTIFHFLWSISQRLTIKTVKNNSFYELSMSSVGLVSSSVNSQRNWWETLWK